MLKNAERYLIIAGILFVMFFLYVIYAANHGALPSLIKKIYMFPGGDKVGHVVLMGILSFFVNLFLHPRAFRVFGFSFFIGSLIVLGLVTIEEFSQLFISNRTFNFTDLFCSILGVIGGDIGVGRYKRAVR